MKPNILFVNLPNIPLDSSFHKSTSNSYLSMHKALPMGILYLSSYIKQNNNIGKVGIIDYVANFEEINNYKSIDEFIITLAKREVDYTPELILISLIFSVSHDFCMQVIPKLHDIWPKAKIIVGGTHATNYAEKLLENEFINYIVRGEGEKGLSEFISQFSSNNEIDVKGIYSREKYRSAKSIEICEFIDNLDEIPFPDWNLVNMEIYTKESFVTLKEMKNDTESFVRNIPILTTRGCPFKCTYCSQYTVHGRSIRYRSIDNVINEMRILNKKYEVTTFIPLDDMFISNKKRVLKLLEAIKELNISGLELQFPNALHVNSLDSVLIDGLVDVGTKIAYLAIESGSNFVQKNIIKKNVDLQKAKEIVTYFHRKGISARCFFILGFPGETKAQMQETVDYAKSLNADWVDFFIATPLIGTEMLDQFIEMGYLNKNEPVWKNAYVRGRHFDTNEISAKDLIEFAYKANLNCNFIDNYNVRTGKYERAIALFNSVLFQYPFHIGALYSIIECYKGLGDRNKVEELTGKVKKLIATDPLAADMYNKYNDLFRFKSDIDK